MANIKTNAMRILETENIIYDAITYDVKDGKIDGISVARKTGRDPKQVYKTLVAKGNSGSVFVFMIPVEKELDLKKAAKVAGEKKVEMVPVKDIRKYTGYIRGGCSPIGMKKSYPIFIDDEAINLDDLIISGGKRGVQIELKVKDLKKITQAVFCKIAKS